MNGPERNISTIYVHLASVYFVFLSRYETVVRKHNVSIDTRYKSFDEIKTECLKKKILFEDPEFPANDESLFYSQRPPMSFKWKRPHVSTFCYVVAKRS